MKSTLNQKEELGTANISKLLYRMSIPMIFAMVVMECTTW